MRKLVVKSIHKSYRCRILFAKEFLDTFKGIVLIIMVRELKEQKCLKELAEVVTESIVWFMRFIHSTLITALVDLMKQVIEFSDVVSQI